MQREGEGGSKEAAVEVTVKKTNRRKEVEEDTPPPLDVGEHPRSQSSFELGHPADINPLRLEFQANEGTAALPTEPAAKKEQHPPHSKRPKKKKAPGGAGAAAAARKEVQYPVSGMYRAPRPTSAMSSGNNSFTSILTAEERPPVDQN